jgi:hypothetical protein
MGEKPNAITVAPTSELDGVELQFDPSEFLTELGIESLASREVLDHEGNSVPLAQALVTCQSARSAISSAVEMIREIGGDDVDVLPHMTKHIDRMGEEARAIGSKKK